MTAEHVDYKGDKYEVLFKYQSGYWELMDQQTGQVILVHHSEVKEAHME
ncbi:hypothetical protein [Cytobacillus gottheilii]|nr:hypothetical protein [Cytobacillus gottheilii]